MHSLSVQHEIYLLYEQVVDNEIMCCKSHTCIKNIKDKNNKRNRSTKPLEIGNTLEAIRATNGKEKTALSAPSLKTKHGSIDTVREKTFKRPHSNEHV